METIKGSKGTNRKINLFSPLMISRIFLVLIIAAVALGETGCASKKKLLKQQELELAKKIADAKAELLAILDDDGSMSIEEKERRLNAVISQNLDDPELNDLIMQVQLAIDQEKEKLRQLEEEKRLIEEELKRKEAEDYAKKMNYIFLVEQFDDIAAATSLEEANSKIKETLAIFANDNVPVLIIVYKEGDVVDYDKPTNIKRYLDFLKDQKKSLNAVENIVYDDNGQITELELIKK